MSEQIGKHKGAVETLLHEKKELSRLLQIVNSQLQRHLSALEEQGINAEEYIEQLQNGQGQQRRTGQSGNERQGQQSGRSSSGNRSRSGSRSRSSGRSRTSEEESGDSGDRDFNPL